MGRRTCVLCPVAIETGTLTFLGTPEFAEGCLHPQVGSTPQGSIWESVYKHREQQSYLRSAPGLCSFLYVTVSEDTLQIVQSPLSNVSLTGRFSPPKPTRENLEEAVHHSVHCSYRNGAQTTSVVTVTDVS